MGKDLRFLVIGSEEADDFAVPCAAVQVVIPVKDHVFRAFELAKANVFCRGNLVVEGVGRDRIGQGRLGFSHTMIDRRHIHLIQNLMSVLKPANVQHNGGSQHEPQHHLVCAGSIPQPDEAIVHDENDDGTHDALGNGAAPTPQTVAANHGRRERQNFEIKPGTGASAAQAAGNQETRNAGTNAGNDIGHEDCFAHADARVMGRAAGAANRQHVKSGARACKRNMGGDGNGDGSDYAD